MEKQSDSKIDLISDVFDLQWELLKKEMDINTESIAQFHEFGKSIKNWTILLWSASIGGALTNNAFTQYIIFVLAIPLLLWSVEAAYRKIQSKFLYRWSEINEFVNSENLELSKKEGRFVGFNLLDILGTDTNNNKYIKMTSWKKIMSYKTSMIFYGSLIIFTIIIWILTFFFDF